MPEILTSRERIEAAMNHREPDRTPIFEYVLLSPLADRLLGRPYAADKTHWSDCVSEKGWNAAVRQNAIDRLDLAVLLGHDMLYVTPNPAPPSTSPSTATPPKPDDPIEALQQRNARAEQQSPPSDDTFLIYVYLKEEMARRSLDLPLFAPAYVHGIWTDTDLMQSMVLAPEAAHRHFRLATKNALARVEKYLTLGVDQIGVGGDFAGTKLMISPEAYRTFIVPEVRAVSRRIHKGNAVAINASDGDLWPIIEDFLFGCEVDGYMEIDMHAGMDLTQLKIRYGDRITLYGNLDCGNTLSFGTPETVRQHTLDCLDAGWGNGGHILCASNAIAESVTLENYLSVVNAYRERFGLPKFS